MKICQSRLYCCDNAIRNVHFEYYNVIYVQGNRYHPTPTSPEEIKTPLRYHHIAKKEKKKKIISHAIQMSAFNFRKYSKKNQTASRRSQPLTKENSSRSPSAGIVIAWKGSIKPISSGCAGASPKGCKLASSALPMLSPE